MRGTNADTRDKKCTCKVRWIRSTRQVPIARSGYVGVLCVSNEQDIQVDNQFKRLNYGAGLDTVNFDWPVRYTVQADSANPKVNLNSAHFCK